MVSWIFAFIGAVIISIIVLLIPVGYTIKGKLFLLLPSISIAGIGLLSQYSFSWIQTTSIVVVLIMGTYILLKRKLLPYEIHKDKEFDLPELAEKQITSVVKKEIRVDKELSNKDISSTSIEDDIDNKNEEVIHQVETEEIEDLENVLSNRMNGVQNQTSEKVKSSDEVDIVNKDITEKKEDRLSPEEELLASRVATSELPDSESMNIGNQKVKSNEKRLESIEREQSFIKEASLIEIEANEIDSKDENTNDRILNVSKLDKKEFLQHLTELGPIEQNGENEESHD